MCDGFFLGLVVSHILECEYVLICWGLKKEVVMLCIECVQMLLRRLVALLGIIRSWLAIIYIV